MYDTIRKAAKKKEAAQKANGETLLMRCEGLLIWASVDFIQRYVFPGGMLPSERRLLREVEDAGLARTHIRRFGQDYARTLAEWTARFDRQAAAVRAQGFDARFDRLWRYYLAYCEAGFRTGRTDVVQLGLAKG